MSNMQLDEIPSDGLNYWLKCHLAVYCTREAIKPLVITVIKQFVKDALEHVSKTNDSATETSCGKCEIQNLLHCPTKEICMIRNSKCNFHNEPNKQYRNCPNGICDLILKKIEKAHRHRPPWKNTDSKQWVGEDLLEIAKCYMPKEGYMNITCFDKLDFNGIINVIINHKGFQKQMADDLSTDQNICCQARNIGNKIRHSNLSIDESDFNEYMDVFMELLSDDNYFRGDVVAQRARDKLANLKSSGHIELRAEEFRKVCQEVENDSDSETKRRNVALVQTIEEKRKEERNKITKTFRSDLIRYYRNRHGTLQVSPLHTNSDESLNDLFVQPEMYFKGPLGRINIGSYHELLYEKIGNRQKDRELREIYITSAPGKGKTTFGKRMAIVWCHAHEPSEKDEKYYVKEDLETLKSFDFFFFIPLKDIIKGRDNYIDSIIVRTIVPDLANEHKYKTADFIPELLSTHRCIIFLDGLTNTQSERGYQYQNGKCETTVHI